MWVVSIRPGALEAVGEPAVDARPPPRFHMVRYHGLLGVESRDVGIGAYMDSEPLRETFDGQAGAISPNEVGTRAPYLRCGLRADCPGRKMAVSDRAGSTRRTDLPMGPAPTILPPNPQASHPRHGPATVLGPS